MKHFGILCVIVYTASSMQAWHACMTTSSKCKPRSSEKKFLSDSKTTRLNKGFELLLNNNMTRRHNALKRLRSRKPSLTVGERVTVVFPTPLTTYRPMEIKGQEAKMDADL